MGDRRCTVHFVPSGREIRVAAGVSVLEAARAAGVHVNASCGGEGVCGTCTVFLLQGTVEGGEHAKLTREEVRRGGRLACTAKVASDLVIRVPETSELDHSAADRGRTGRGGAVLAEEDAWARIHGLLPEPVVAKVSLRLPPPSREDPLSDLDRLLLALKRKTGIVPVGVSLSAARTLAAVLRRSNWAATAVLVHLRDLDRAGRRYRLIRVEEGDTTRESYALAVDLGTTTLAAQLLDLGGLPDPRQARPGWHSGLVRASASMYNPQVSYGEDVISRIVYAARPGGLDTLRRAAVEGINGLVDQVVSRAGVDRSRVNHVVVAGNSTMTQILLGLDPQSIRRAPYVTTVSHVPVTLARTVGLDLGEHVPVWCFPLVASWVGGDVVAGVLGSGLWQDEATTLLIDLGTNGEIVLGNREWMVTTSCSAGPAFEGGGIRCGMRAAAGAIEEVALDPDTLEPALTTIGGVRPRGICGSGLIAAVGELFDKGVLAPNGRYDEGAATDRLRRSESGGREFVLAWAKETGGETDLVLTEADVDNLIRAKAAIYAGSRVLLRSVGLTFDDVDRVLIAGGFGQSLDLQGAQRIGLLHPLPPERFLFLGNAALLGARLVSASRRMFDTAYEVAAQMTHVDLADNPAFLDEYVAAKFLPHTDLAAG
ncbi:MAG: ASKHA domain-containing protein [Deferrisomatales bacterium]